MNKKRILLTVLAMVLVCVLSVAGTMALLAENGGAVVNTFVAAGGPGPFVDEGSFAIKEYQYTQETNGTYTQSVAVTGEASKNYVVNEYKVMPGTTIPKKAFVTLTRTAKDGVNPAPAYLFIEVKSDLTTVYTWTVDSANWKSLGIKGSHGGDIYVKATNNTADVLTVAALSETNATILTNNSIAVADTATAEQISTNPLKLEFYAYLSQATVAKTVDGVTSNTSDPAEVFDICF